MNGPRSAPDLRGGKTTKIPGYSIIIGTAVNDDERIALAEQCRNTDDVPYALVPIQAALQHGAQTISRSELTAMLQTVRRTPRAHIFADSRWGQRSIWTCPSKSWL